MTYLCHALNASFCSSQGFSTLRGSCSACWNCLKGSCYSLLPSPPVPYSPPWLTWSWEGCKSILRDPGGTESRSWIIFIPWFCCGRGRCGGEASLDITFPRNGDPGALPDERCKSIGIITAPPGLGQDYGNLPARKDGRSWAFGDMALFIFGEDIYLFICLLSQK